jgi:FdhD protein
MGGAVRGRTAKVLSHRFDGHDAVRRPDEVIVEEPLAIHLDDVLVATTMRTPGHDFELAVGFLHGDGLLGGAPVVTCRYCGQGPERPGAEGALSAKRASAVDTEFNVVSVDTGGRAPAPTPRLTVATAACGLCGSTSLDELVDRLEPLPTSEPFPLELLAAVPDRMVAEQGLFDATGAVHAAAAFDRDGEPLVVREDIGRHNAVDKVVGRLLLDGRLPATGHGLFVSGRASFEMVQKAWAAGFAAVVAVSGPSSLAVDTARAAGLTLAGFTRGGTLNLYSPERPALGGPR